MAYGAGEIAGRVGELAGQIAADLAGERPLMVSVLKGSVIFLADLIRALPGDPAVDFMSITSYGDAPDPSGVVRIVKDLEEPIEGRHVIVIEDLVDTGLSLSYLVRALADRDPASLRVCAFVDKSVRRIAELDVDYVGFSSEEFLIGYGLDLRGHFRNMPCLMALSPPAVAAAANDLPADLEGEIMALLKGAKNSP